MKPTHSLQKELSRWIILTAFAFMVIGGLVSSAIAFWEAKDIQDSLLREIGSLVRYGHLGDNSSSLDNNEGEEISILIQPVDPPLSEHSVHFPQKLKEGLQTLKLDGESWRVLMVTQLSSGLRYIIAQQTELRDDLALASGLNVFLPMLVLVALMLLMINWIIRREFKPLQQLANQLKQQNALQPETMPEKGLPLEIAPFVTAINDLLERIQQTLHRQQRFIADAAHELRTPVTALSLLAENVDNASNESDRNERQKQLQKGLLRLRKLLNQLLDLARLQSNQQNPKQTVSFKTIVLEAIADLYPLAEKADIDLGATDLEEVSVLDQDSRLQQLVRNAISNAINHTPKGGKINVSLKAINQHAVFQVDDTGDGIPEEVITQVFEPFYRVQNDASTQTGNGLGLAISNEIAQRLEGRIVLKNKPEGGLVFIYTQPYQDHLE